MLGRLRGVVSRYAAACQIIIVILICRSHIQDGESHGKRGLPWGGGGGGGGTVCNVAMVPAFSKQFSCAPCVEHLIAAVFYLAG